MSSRHRTQALQLSLLFIVLTSFSFMVHTISYYLTGSHSSQIPLESPCIPKKNLVFLKTHKTASSTILNILYRYGEAHNLTFALPFYDHLGYPERFKAGYVKNFDMNRPGQFNILCNHMRFYHPEVKKVVPSDSFYFSIVRDPIRLAESSFAYYRFYSPAFKKADSLDEFAASAESNYKGLELNNHYARNLMWFDFGHDNNMEDVPGYVNTILAQLDRIFGLVLVAEYFDESLILLKEALCWNLEDVVYFKLNARSSNSVAPMNASTMERLQAWNHLDWRLYSHYNASFWQRVSNYGTQKMERDVAQLKALSHRLASVCLQINNSTGFGASKPMAHAAGTAKLLGYVLKANLSGDDLELCHRMVLPEKQHLTLLQRRQYPKTPPVGK
ncbi:galactose-3-O-sulfotransferase 2-like isoform X2 [Rhincodon typus]|nr:galactose-3-O-sulfotransferase 2-like isoform X2 [Rhincodon typus]XP_048476065.1 galactose-3-O-sulfotransferase 2-like isoform X2 [Rhincodon typus]XP_048476066.1 galactose-3-O-sulfotransferase 2-like isoform X2 [Rhincodon typus]XP_048476067.1 galactose-3-O-sulfotransferase 2-like isoform X2 [Rhincodon typus]